MTAGDIISLVAVLVVVAGGVIRLETRIARMEERVSGLPHQFEDVSKAMRERAVLVDRWIKVVYRRLNMMDDRLGNVEAIIEKELTQNGGTSLRDRVATIESTVATIQSAVHALGLNMGQTAEEWREHEEGRPGR